MANGSEKAQKVAGDVLHRLRNDHEQFLEAYESEWLKFFSPNLRLASCRRVVKKPLAHGGRFYNTKFWGALLVSSGLGSGGESGHSCRRFEACLLLELLGSVAFFPLPFFF